MHYFVKMEEEKYPFNLITYHVAAEDALFMYRTFADFPDHCKNMPEGGPEEAYSTGTELATAKNHFAVIILWGHRLTTDQEIFKQILEGKFVMWRH